MSDEMKQLTRTEIIELRARAIAKTFYHSAGDFENIKDDFDTDEIYANECWDLWEAEAIATIEADEKAGVLTLVENIQPQNGDLVEYQRYNGGFHLGYDIKASTGAWVNDITVREVIKRDNVLVYQCAKPEAKND